MKLRTKPQPKRRPDGLWRLDVQVGNGSREHRVRRSLYGSSAAEVLAKYEEIARREAIGLGPIDAHLTVGTYLVAWADGLTGLRPRTLESYRATVEHHLVPRLGHVSLVDLRATDIRRMVRVLETEIGTRTAGYALTVLRIALNVAVRDRLLERNEATWVTEPVAERVEHRPLSIPQTSALLEQVRGDRLEAFYVLAIETGWRRGELLALGWDDIDLDAATARVTRTLLYRVGESYDLVPPKTSRSRRISSLTPRAVAALRARKAAQRIERVAAGPSWSKGWDASQLVFSTKTGGAIAGTTVGHALHRHLRAAGLPPQRVHDLRHLNATLLFASGVSLREVSDQLGHSTIAVTSDIYVHTAPVDRGVSDVMGRLFGGAQADEAAR